MSKDKLILKSSFISILSQIINAVISFINRSIFIKTLGVSILGINGVISNWLGMLSLAELGFGSAITQSLYKPFIDKDTETISSIMKLYKKIYRYIGIIVFILGIISMFFLESVIKDTDLKMDYIYTVYLLQLLSIVSTYFFSYKRTMLYIDQKQYIIILYDLLVNVIVSIIKIFVLIKYKNYIVYLSIQIMQNIMANIIISTKVNKLYPYINKSDISPYSESKRLFNNMKDIIFGKIAGYIYGSTDNLIISSFLGISYVGKLSNYTMISSLVKSFLGSIVGPLQAIYGNFIHKNNDSDKIMYMIEVYTFARYILVSVLIIPTIILLNTFIELWIGRDFLLSKSVVLLVAIDIFIGSVSGPMGEFIAVLGLFKADKKISIVATFVNLFISLLLVRYIGIEGVLIGTAISQIFFWLGRATAVFNNNIINLKPYVLRYIKNILTYIVIVIVNLTIISIFINKFILIQISMFNFIISVFVCVVLNLLLNVFLFHKNSYYKYLYDMFIRKYRR